MGVFQDPPSRTRIWGFWPLRGGPPWGGRGSATFRPPGGAKCAHFVGYLITLPVGTDDWPGTDPRIWDRSGTDRSLGRESVQTPVAWATSCVEFRGLLSRELIAWAMAPIIESRRMGCGKARRKRVRFTRPIHERTCLPSRSGGGLGQPLRYGMRVACHRRGRSEWVREPGWVGGEPAGSPGPTCAVRTPSEASNCSCRTPLPEDPSPSWAQPLGALRVRLRLGHLA